jgi:hypothetical protein
MWESWFGKVKQEMKSNLFDFDSPGKRAQNFFIGINKG